MYPYVQYFVCYTRVLTVEKATNAGPVHIGWLVGDRFVRPQIIPDNTHVRIVRTYCHGQADRSQMRERERMRGSRVQLTLQISGQKGAL